MKYGDRDCAPHSINCESIGAAHQLEVDLEFGQDSRIHRSDNNAPIGDITCAQPLDKPGARCDQVIPALRRLCL